METYKPPYTITERMIELVASISEKVGRISVIREKNAKPHLRKNNRIKSVHASLKIEANSLSLAAVSDVINGQRVVGDSKEIREVKNAYAAYEKIGKIDPYSLKDLKSIHGLMTAGLVEESGVFRKGEEGVFSGGQCIFIAPPPLRVPDLMSDLFSWMKKECSTLHPLILSSVFHYEFVFIHPFSDGNGRMARLWQTVLLYRWREIFEMIPVESQIEKCQAGYYDAISRCHVAGNSNAFIEFMLEQIDLVLNEMDEERIYTAGNLSEYVKKLLSVMTLSVPYTTKDLMALLHLKSKETFRKNYMRPALENGLVEMTIPDKPRSRNQRYVRKR